MQALYVLSLFFKLKIIKFTLGRVKKIHNGQTPPPTSWDIFFDLFSLFLLKNRGVNSNFLLITFIFFTQK